MKSLLAISLTLSFCLVAVIGLMIFKKLSTVAPTVIVIAPATTPSVVPAVAKAVAPATALTSANADSKTVAVVMAVAEDKVPLLTKLPVALFIGTPVPLKLSNLEPVRVGKRPDFLVPLGTVNLAKGKKVTSSDNDPVMGTLDLVTDGDKAGDEGSWVELAPGKQWVQIDLEKESEIFAVLVWHFHAQARAYLGVVVQISDDPEFKTGVTTIFNNDAQNVHGFGAGQDYTYVENNEGKLIDANGVKGRYVRLYSAGNTTNKLNHYIEVEVFGKPAA